MHKFFNMKTIKSLGLVALSLTFLLLPVSCSKNKDTNSLYTPTSADVTANATLDELQQGRSLYINNCGRCHALVSPDNYNPTQWKTILSSMAPRTNMSTSQVQLVTKYVSKGNQ
jgi:mono/diheme cytochrome c family protein